MDGYRQQIFTRLEKISGKLQLVEGVFIFDLYSGIGLVVGLAFGHAQAGGLLSVEIDDGAVVGQDLQLEIAELESLWKLKGVSEICLLYTSPSPRD